MGLSSFSKIGGSRQFGLVTGFDPYFYPQISNGFDPQVDPYFWTSKTAEYRSDSIEEQNTS